MLASSVDWATTNTLHNTQLSTTRAPAGRECSLRGGGRVCWQSLPPRKTPSLSQSLLHGVASLVGGGGRVVGGCSREGVTKEEWTPK